MWFGGAGFFNFVTAPTIFESFKEVVETAPSDRTAGFRFSHTVRSGQEPKLANALAGAAVGPVFPKYFAMQAVCGLIALVTAASWWRAEGGRTVHRRRVYVIVLALITIAIGWPISNYVSELRPQRFSTNTDIASAADAAFVQWHLVSLLLSFVTVALAGVALWLAAKLPNRGSSAS
jgi:hypothetical protein